MSRLRRKLITLYAFIIFLLSALFGAIPVALYYRLRWPHDESRKLQFHGLLCGYFHWCARHIPMADVSVVNPTGEDFSRPAIIICNHQSHLDLVATLMLSPRIAAMTNRWVWNFPLYAPIIRYCEFYPAHDGLEANEEKIRSLFDRGYSVLIFPEGTRSADCSIGRFHRGAFYLAERAGVDIIPLYLDGPGRVLPKMDFCLNPGHITVTIGQRISNDDQSMGSDYREKTRKWHQHYLELSRNNTSHNEC